MLACFLTIPWMLIAVVAFGLLPEGWRFEGWPAGLRGVSLSAFVLFLVADTVWAAWCLFLLVIEAYGTD